MIIGKLIGDQRGSLHDGQSLPRLAMNELRAELNRQWKIRKVRGPDAAADARTRLENSH